MDHIGIDVHKRESQICIFATDGELIEQRIAPTRERLTATLGSRAPAKILVEASTESEWVARLLEGMGHEVIVADPNFAAMYATRGRRVKTDRRDARTLAEACRLGAYRPAHRTSDEQRHVRAQLAVRESLVRTRTKFISLVGALLRREGWRIRSGAAEAFAKRVGELALPAHLRSEIAPLLAVMVHVNAQIAELDQAIEQIVESDERVDGLCTAPGVGPITAAAFVSSIDEAKRFRSAHQVEAYLGLVPSEQSSGERQRKGAITKAGDGRVRGLLVEAALCIMRVRTAQGEALRQWAERIKARRGSKIAAVALARKLAGILFAMMRDGSRFRPRPFRHGEYRASHDQGPVAAHQRLRRAYEPYVARRVLPRGGPQNLVRRARRDPSRPRSLHGVLQLRANPPGLPCRWPHTCACAPRRDRGRGPPATLSQRPGAGGRRRVADHARLPEEPLSGKFSTCTFMVSRLTVMTRSGARAGSAGRQLSRWPRRWRL